MLSSVIQTYVAITVQAAVPDFPARFVPAQRRHLQELARLDSASVFLQPRCSSGASESCFCHVALMTTTEVEEQSARGGGWGWLLLLTLCNAARQPPPSTTTPAELPCKSVPVPFQLLGSAWAFTNPASPSLIVQSLAFTTPPPALTSPPSPSLLLFPLICLPPPPLPAPFVFQCIFIFMDLNHSCHLSQLQQHHWHMVGLFLTGASLYLPARVNSSIFEWCEILRWCRDNRASPNLMQYS